MPIDRFQFERALFEKGLSRVAGVDEAGRGPLAGPVVAAAVYFPSAWIQNGLPPELDGLNDSKQLKEGKRSSFFDFLTTHSDICFGIAVAGVEIIDSINILQASLGAMNEALEKLEPPPEHTLVDGLQRSTSRHPQTPIVEGDARSFSIAAASVLAKVTRDRIMVEYDREYPQYGFARHKGYGTAQHLKALSVHGPCPLHRRSFAPVRTRQQELFSDETSRSTAGMV